MGSPTSSKGLLSEYLLPLSYFIRYSRNENPSASVVNVRINAFCQILKKVFPTAYENEIEGVVLHPIRVNATFV